MALTAVVNYSKCNPGLCELGRCFASKECPLHILQQRTPFEKPYIDTASRKLTLLRVNGCFKCLGACPIKAIEKTL